MMDQRTFIVTLRPEPEGGFTVRVPAFPEIVSYGKDEAEAPEMAKEAIEFSAEHRLANGELVPASENVHWVSVVVAS